MIYTVAVTKTGQMTLPKAVRELLGVTNRAVVRVNKDNTVSVYRQPTFAEQLDELHASLDAGTKRALKNMAGKTVHELMDEWADSPEGKAYYKEKYGL